MKIIQFLMFFFVIAMFQFCDNPERDYNQTRKAVIENFHQHSAIFDSLYRLLRFGHLSTVEILDNDKVNLLYCVGTNGKDTGYIKIDQATITSNSVVNALKLDHYTIDEFKKIRNFLQAIHVDRIELFDNFSNITGKYYKQAELKFAKKIDHVRFFYKIYESNLENPENENYTILISDGKTGGKLNNKIIWYSR